MSKPSASHRETDTAQSSVTIGRRPSRFVALATWITDTQTFTVTPADFALSSATSAGDATLGEREFTVEGLEDVDSEAPDELAPATASRAVKGGRMRRVARGLVTDELTGPIEGVVAAHLLELVARILPGAVIVDRSARAGGPVPAAHAAERILHVAHPTRRRDLELPGHLVQVRTAPGPVVALPRCAG